MKSPWRWTLATATAVLLLMIAVHAYGQRPERMYGKNRVLKSNTYYLEQIAAWEALVRKHPENADAWLNYYRASRNAYIVGEETDSLNTKGGNRFSRLRSILDRMQLHVPESFEYNFAMWLNGNGSPELLPYLEKAHWLKPDEPEPLLSLAYHHELTSDTARRNSFLAVYYRTGAHSPGLLNYAWNMLAALDSNAIVFTEGDKDTDGMLVLQGARNFRRDVRVVNVNLLLNAAYRRKLMTELGVAPFDFDPMQNDASLDRYKRGLVRRFAENASRRPVYVAVSVSEPYREAVAAELYLDGLAYRYSDTSIDVPARLLHLYERVYSLDYLRIYLPYDISEGNMREFNQNYLPSLALLVRSLRKVGNDARADFYANLARSIADDAASYRIYRMYFTTE
jgi:hypothetical protein